MFLPIEVYQGQPAATETTMYTVPAGRQLVVKEFVICNTDTSARTITIHVRRGGVAADVTRRILSARSIPAGETVYFPCSVVMGAGSILSGLSSAAGFITVTVSGEECAV